MPRRDEGFFSARDNTRLFWQSTLPDSEPTAFVGVVHGYADHLGRYQGIINHLVSEGFGVLAFDYRGHGKADGKRGFCKNFSEYLDDLEVFWARLRGMAQGRSTFLLAHSHGALMALHWVLRRPEGLKGLVVTSPYLKLALTPPTVKVLGAKVAGLFAPHLPIKTELSVKDLSRDVGWQKETAADPLYFHIVTPRWFTESTAAQEALAGRGRDIQVPILFVAGENDGVASTPAAKSFFQTVASSDKTFKAYPGMLHETMNELGKEEVWAEIASWISAHR